MTEKFIPVSKRGNEIWAMFCLAMAEAAERFTGRDVYPIPCGQGHMIPHLSSEADKVVKADPRSMAHHSFDFVPGDWSQLRHRLMWPD